MMRIFLSFVVVLAAMLFVPLPAEAACNDGSYRERVRCLSLVAGQQQRAIARQERMTKQVERELRRVQPKLGSLRRDIAILTERLNTLTKLVDSKADKAELDKKADKAALEANLSRGSIIKLRNQDKPTQCIDLNTYNQDDVKGWPCNPHPAQNWRIE